MTNQNRKYKIALVGDSLAGGGAEKVHAQLSVFFTQYGLEVHNCIFQDKVSYDYSGDLVNIGKVRPDSSSWVRKVSRFIVFRRFIASGDFDFVIDFRMRPGFLQEFVFSKFVYDKRTIYSVRSGILEFYFPKSALLSRIIYQNNRIHTVSNAVRDKIRSLKLASHPTCIYNPVDLQNVDIKKQSFQVDVKKYIIAVGRMNDEVKQFGQLIRAYSKSELPGQNIQLLILGDGAFRQKYVDSAAELGLHGQVVFKDFEANPFPYYHNAIFSVLSSKNEGFPNVIIEALASGIPAVAFDCFSGPGEIIVHQHNGLLVKDQDFDALIRAMNRMVQEPRLYDLCKQNARESVQRFDIQNIGRQWLEYLKIT